MIEKLIKLPILKRLIPSILTRYFRITNKSRKFYKIGEINFYLDFLDPMDREIILYKNYEYNQVLYIEKKMNNKSFSHFIDIGSNSGYYTFYFANKFKKLQINSFEPNSDAYNKFVKTLNKNSFKNIELFKFGLSNIEKKIQTKAIIRHGYVQSNLTILESDINAKDRDDITNFNNKSLDIKEIIVKVGDNIFNFKNKFLCFKIDVEGHEIYTLEGLINNLRNNKCLVLIEIFDFNFHKVNKFFKDIDYRQTYFFKNTSYYVFSNIN